MYTWGLWSALPFAISGIAYGQIWAKMPFRNAKSEFLQAMYILIPAIIGLVIALSAVYEYTT